MHARRARQPRGGGIIAPPHITYPRPEAELLLAIRKGELPYKDVAEMLETGLDRLEECHRISTLPDRGDQDAAERFILETYRLAVPRQER